MAYSTSTYLLSVEIHKNKQNADSGSCIKANLYKHQYSMEAIRNYSNSVLTFAAQSSNGRHSGAEFGADAVHFPPVAVGLAQLVTVAAADAAVASAAAAVCSAASAASAVATAAAVALTLPWPHGVQRHHSQIHRSHPPPCPTNNSRAAKIVYTN